MLQYFPLMKNYIVLIIFNYCAFVVANAANKTIDNRIVFFMVCFITFTLLLFFD